MRVRIYNHIPIVFMIDGDLTQSYVADCHKNIQLNLKEITKGSKREIERESAGYDCRVNPQKINDLLSWENNICEWSTRDMVKISKLQTIIYSDPKVPINESHWEIYFGEVKNE